MMKFFTLAAAAIAVLSTALNAQIAYDGAPLNWPNSRTAPGTSVWEAPPLDHAALQAEDLVRDQYKEFGYRFAVDVPVGITSESGWTANGPGQVWHHIIRCPGAVSMNFTFSKCRLPKGTRMVIWDVNGSEFLGAFDHRSNPQGDAFAVGLIYSDEVVIELQMDRADGRQPEIELETVHHGYRDVLSKWNQEAHAWEKATRGPFGNSGACNVNVNCPEGADWETESRSVALIVSGGFASCTGAMVNNTAQDGTPYFLTANHCLGGENNWVFYFNHESATCAGNNGPTNQSVSGSVLRASNAGSDFALLELNETPPASYNVQYAGWDNSDDPVAWACGIHHPSGDVKKICFEDDNLSQQNWGGAATWRVANWDLGVTEPGSSGSPLFDPDHRIVGQLYGGSAACSGTNDNNQPDYYGRFATSWDGNSASTRLRDWLDPNNTGQGQIDGWPEGAEVLALDAASGGFLNLPTALCSAEPITPVFRLQNLGTLALNACTISISYNGTPQPDIDWSGTMAQGGFDDLTLPTFYPVSGTNTLTASISLSGDENTFNNTVQNSFELQLGEETIEITIATDDYGYETYWELRAPNGAVVLSGGNEDVGPNGGGAANAGQNDPGAYDDNADYSFSYAVQAAGCYTFVIVDDYGDGICCDFGLGSYTITDANGTTLASGGTFTEMEESTFGMDAGTAVGETAAWDITVYPNPAADELVVQSPTPMEQLEILDGLGRTVRTVGAIHQQRMVLDIADLPSGWYALRVASPSGVVVQAWMKR